MNTRIGSVLGLALVVLVILIPALVLGQEPSPLEESARKLGESAGRAFANILIYGGIFFGLFLLILHRFMASAVRLGIEKFLKGPEGKRLLESLASAKGSAESKPEES